MTTPAAVVLHFSNLRSTTSQVIPQIRLTPNDGCKEHYSTTVIYVTKASWGSLTFPVDCFHPLLKRRQIAHNLLNWRIEVFE